MTVLQQSLATGDVIYKRFSFLPPGLVALEEESDAVQCHTRPVVHPGIMGIDMKKELINTQCIVTVQQRFQHGRVFIPYATNFSKAFGLDNILSINMRTADGIQHIIGFIMRRTVQPKFPHRQIHFLIMHQSVTDHSRSYALGRKTTIILTGTISQYGVEHISHQFSDGGTDIPQYLLTASGAFHRNTCQQRKIRHQIISTAFLKFRREVITPVLTATLPTVYVHIFQYTACHGFIRLFEHFRKPVRELFLNSLGAELVAFQSFTSSGSSIHMSGCRMSHAENTPFTFG